MTTRSKTCCVLASVWFASMCNCTTSAQQYDYPPGTGPGDEPFIEQVEAEDQKLRDQGIGGNWWGTSVAQRVRKLKIEKELRENIDTLPKDHWAHEFAGVYYEGDGLGTNITISVAPNAGVTYTWYGCMGLYDAAHGEIVETFDDGVRVKLITDSKVGDDGMDYMTGRLTFLRWGDKRYLLPENEMTQLMNDLNNRKSYFFFPERDMRDRLDVESISLLNRTQPVGLPQLSDRWNAMLIRTPIKLTVIGVDGVYMKPFGDDSAHVGCQLALNKGSAAGMFVGMEFNVKTDSGEFPVTVTETNDHSCRAEIAWYVLDPNPAFVPPEKGQQIIVPGVDPARLEAR